MTVITQAGPAPWTATGVARRTASSAAWAMVAYGSARALSTGTNVVVARLLEPSEIGLVSFALIFITGCRLLQDLGVTSAVIYGGHDLRAVAGTALTLNIAAAVGLFVVLLLSTPFVANLQADPATPLVLVTLSFGLIVTSLGSIQSAVLMKELDYRRKLVPDALPYAVSGAVSIVMALTGFGVWSLVAGYLVRTITSTASLWLISNFRPVPEWRVPVAVDLLSYGKHVSFQGILGFVSNNIDYLVIGYVLGAHSLGVYTMAFMVANLMPTLSQTALSVIFPALSRLRDDRPALEALLTDAHRLVWLLTLPAAIVLFMGAPAVVSLLLGQQWVDSIVPLRILVIAAGLTSVVQIYGPALKAAGRPDLIWKFVLVRCVVSTPLLLWSAGHGVNGVAACVVFVVITIATPLSIIVGIRTLAYPTDKLLRAITPALSGGAAMCALVLVVYLVPGGRDASESLIGTIALAGAALLLYAAIVFCLDPTLRDQMWAVWARFSRGRRQSESSGAPIGVAYSLRGSFRMSLDLGGAAPTENPHTLPSPTGSAESRSSASDLDRPKDTSVLTHQTTATRRLRVLSVTNMYPTPQLPAFGTFVFNEVQSLRRSGAHVDVLLINGRSSLWNYLLGPLHLWRALSRKQYDVIHAHYVLTGVITRLQWSLPVVLTHHGPEVIGYPRWQTWLSKLVTPFFDQVIYRTEEMRHALHDDDGWVIPAGIDFQTFVPRSRSEARAALNLPNERRLVLWAGEYWRPEKCFSLADDAVKLVKQEHPDVELVVLTMKPQEVVPIYMSACDALVLTSSHEGSPNVVKEAMACNLPIVSVRVGDVPEIIAGTNACVLAERDPADIARKLIAVLQPPRRSNGRSQVQWLAHDRITPKILNVYTRAVESRKTRRAPR